MATSYGAIAYSRWLSNPSVVPFFILLLIFSFCQFIRGREKYLILLAACWAMIFHAEVVSALFFLPTLGLIFFLVKPKVPSKKILLVSLLTIGLILSSYLFFEWRHHFLMTQSAYQFFVKKSGFSFGLNLEPLRGLLKEYGFIIFPFQPKVSTVLFIISFAFALYRSLIKKQKKEKKSLLIVIFWLIGTPLTLIFYSHAIHSHFFIALGPAMILLTAYFLNYFLEKKRVIGVIGLGLLLTILANNLWLFKTALPQNRGIAFYGAQEKVTFDNQIKVVDFLYQQAKGEPFRYEALGLPYFLNHAWEYLFGWYGEKKYGYLPEKKETNLVYLIIENKAVEPQFQKHWLKEKKKVLNFLSAKQIGEIEVIKAQKNQ